MRKNRFYLAFCLVIAFIYNSAFADSQRMQNPGNGHWYQRFDTSMSWNDAKVYCESLGGYLATITSPEENDFVYNNVVIGTPYKYCWLGGTDEDIEGSWKWSTGEQWSYTNWFDGEPSNSCGNEHYLSFYSPLHTGDRPGHWNDIKSTVGGAWGCALNNLIELSTICEWDDGKIKNPSNGHWYQRFDTSMSWYDAKVYCENRGGHLATITSQQENDFVYNNVVIGTPFRYCWLGGTDDDIEGNWKWATGEQWSYTNWYDGEPSNSCGNENYLSFYSSLHTDDAPGHWNDIRSVDGGGWGCILNNFIGLSTICEWDNIINVVSPNGGETWIINSIYDIKWSLTGNTAKTRIEITRDVGTGWETIIPSTPNNGRYFWTVTGPSSSNCKIRISDASDGYPSDVSDSIFSIAVSPETPTVTTNEITAITANSAVCGGNIASDGGSPVTAKGVCWSTSSNPTTANIKTTDGTGNGSFTSTITGLSPNTIYYVRAYAANIQGTSYGNERNFKSSSEVIYNTLSVKSTPELGVPVTVTPNDKNGQSSGTTNFNRTYYPGVEVTLTAPASYNGKDFIKWKVDNADRAGRTTKISMNTDHTAQAVYRASTCSLTVQSSPESGIPIIVSPKDKNNNGNGNTVFIRTYDSGTIVTLTAPSTFNDKNFVRWLVDGSETINRTINVTMDTNHTAQVVYQSDTYILTVQSSPYTGLGITVDPVDKNGNGNGNTNFTRTYEPGEIVTLTAPSVFTGSNFIKWSVDGKEYSNRSIQVTIEANHNAVVYYETTNPAEISVTRASLNFGYIIGSSRMPQETFSIYNSGGGTLNWSANTEIENIVLKPTSGTNCGVVEIKINPIGLLPAIFTGVIYITDPLVSNSPVEVKINLCVKQQAFSPFGDFSTPLDDSTVYSSIPVTGWALGDTGIDSVKIYREEGSNLVYIGDAFFVEGARPDVEAAYPDYPMNYKASWGYMMLTHFLPNNGNGVYKIHAIATDKEGFTADLGTKTITVINSLAIKPFGAIDFPAPGGTASGDNYRNHGWAVTPRPNKIPENGSTINVYVDGKYLGHPTYNIYRPDIASLFPGYVNVNGAGGYFDFDTTAYENGIHTIYWTATDNAGNSDGIGSRFFTIQNTGSAAGCISQNAAAIAAPLDMDLSAIPIDYSEPVKIIKGFTESPDAPDALEMYPNENGIIEIEIKELERLEIHLTQQAREDVPLLNCKCYLVVNDQLRPLPIGSTLDSQRGIFYWQPGPGFVGKYHFIFIEKKPNGELSRRNVSVEILPKYSQ